MLSAGRIAFLVVAMLAYASWWLNKQGHDGLDPEERPVPDGFYMIQAEITTAGIDGLPRYRLIADEIRQLHLGGPTQLADVRIEYNIVSPNPWLLTAPEGLLSADQALLELWGGVAVLGESSDHGPTSVATERLEIDTESHIARSAVRVDLALGDQQLSGIGMEAHLLEERLQLQSEVHGRFLP